MPPADVYFYEVFEEEADALRSHIRNEFTYELDPRSVQETGHRDPPAQIVSVRTQSMLPTDWSNKVRGVLSRSTGYDHLIAYRKQIPKPVPLGFLEEYSTRAVAEQAILFSLALLRKLPRQMAQLARFERDGLSGLEARGRNLLVVGVGRIGSEIVRIARGVGFTVMGVDIVRREPDVSYVEREKGIAWADVIVCAMNLTDENRGYFSYDLLRRARRGSLFINIARGEHSPLAALVRLLDERLLGGVALDVFEDEPALASALRAPSPTSHPLLPLIRQLSEFPNVILTPHNAFNTAESVDRKAKFTVEQILHLRQYGEFKWKV